MHSFCFWTGCNFYLKTCCSFIRLLSNLVLLMMIVWCPEGLVFLSGYILDMGEILYFFGGLCNLL